MFFSALASFFSKIFCFTGYINNKNSFPHPLSEEDEKKYLIAVKSGDKLAREMLIRHNLRLVAHVAKKYSNVVDTDDLISIGSIGLIKGIESFEFSKGTALATYVARCIDNEILMHLRANKKHIRTRSLSESVGMDKDGNEITLMDIIPCENENIFSKVEASVTLEKVGKLTNTILNKRERLIIEMRYGLPLGVETKTQIEVAGQLKISRSYVSRIEKKALQKIKAALDG